MTQPSVHQSTTIPATLSKTPAIGRTTRKAHNTLLNRTVGSKPRHFEIFIDSNQPCPSSTNEAPHRLSKPTISATPANKNKTIKNVAAPSTRKKLAKPLEDKTNTIRKKKNVEQLSLEGGQEQKEQHSPSLKDQTKPSSTLNSHQPSAPTPHQQAKKAATFRPGISPPNTKLRLLYRTPTTAKRASRPPQPQLFGSDAEDEDEEEDDDQLLDRHPSPIKSAFQLNFNLGNVPDVEFGPPSAIIEQVDYPSEDNQVDFSGFFESLHDSQNHLISSSGSPSSLNSAEMTMGRDNLAEEIKRVKEEDGRKELWTREPACQMTTYEGAEILDDLHLPPPIRPTSTGTRKTRPTSSMTRQPRLATSRPTDASSRPAPVTRRPAPARSTRATLTHGPSSSSTLPPSKPAVHHPPILARFHLLINSLVRQEQSLIHEDLILDNLLLLPPGSQWETGLDDFLLDL